VVWPSTESDFNACGQEISKVFPSKDTPRRRKATRYEQTTLSLIEAQDTYTNWQRSATSALLFFHGDTIPEARLEPTSTYSWLSPAASLVADIVSRNKKALLAYYCCHPGVRAEKKRTLTVLSTLIYQLLSQRPSILRLKKGRWLESAAHFTGEETIQAQKGILQLLRELLIELAKIEEITMTYIIIDRVDQCSISTPQIMNQLADLVVDNEIKVKLMVICDLAFSEGWDTNDLGGRLLRERVYAKGPWTQQLL
jgi:hypothetical protein